MSGLAALRPSTALLALVTVPLVVVPLVVVQLVSAGPAFGAGSVRSEFMQICAESRDGDLRFYGRRPAVELAARLAETRGPSSERLELLVQLGQQQLQLGEIDASLETLDQAFLEAPDDLDAGRRAALLSAAVLAHLQAAEDLNCVAHANPASCILPLRPGGMHEQAEHARRAGDLALELAAIRPGSYEIAWTLNLARMVSGDYPEGVPEALRLPADALTSEQVFPAWRDRSVDLGLSAVELAGGAIVDDFDGDGLLDLVTSTWDPCASLRAYRNDGRGGFVDQTAAWGLDEQLGGMNLTQADYDNDGDLDLLVLRGGWLFSAGRIRNSLLRNDRVGEGVRFVDVTAQLGLAEPAFPTQTAAWADYDLDGDLDLFIGNEHSGQTAYRSQLFRNDLGEGFRDVTWESGTANLRLAKGVAWGDYDDDGDPDLYVSNEGANRLYRNRGDGTFEDVAESLGVDRPLGWSFVPWFFDHDNDGDLDLFVIDYNARIEAVAAYYFGVPVEKGRPVLYQNQGDGTFVDVSHEVGFEMPVMAMGANFGDLDNDGWSDAYLATGEPSFQSQVPNIMLRNTGSGFVDVTAAGSFGHIQKGHGVAFGDVDNDGDQDLLHQIGGFYPADAFRNALFENPGNDSHWLTLRLVGRESNRFGVGARIEVRVRRPSGESRSIHAVVGPGGSFGGNSLQAEIGLGDAEQIEAVVVHWPGGRRQEFSLAPDRIYSLVEGEAPVAVELPRLVLGSG